MKIKICEICGRTSVETIIVTSNGHHYCNRCYQRMRNSKVYQLPLKGEVKYSEDGKPICHICGRAFNKLMLHVYQVHNMTSYKYKKEFGLDLHNSIMSEKSKEIARQRAYQYIDINIRNLQKGAKYRFKPGSSGRTREKISLQTLNKLKKNGFKKGGV